ncbi:MAG: D-glycero-beta-D-manno-heptose-7-phosphate kinase [Alphaproteobacteria bacterium]
MTDALELPGLIGRLGTARVLCVGDAMLDRFVEGRVDRISPEAPIPVFAVTSETSMPGGAGNVVRNLAALGAQATLVGTAGDDVAGTELDRLLAAETGASACLIKTKGRGTTIKTRFVAAGQQLLRADHETTAPLAAGDRQALVEAALAALDTAGVLVLSDYGKGVLSDDVIATLIDAARRRSVPVIVDPKGADYRRYRGASLVTPNRQELTLATGMPARDDAAVLAAAGRLIADCGIEAVLATRSEQGMTLVTADAEATSARHFPARARAVFDVSGAGDTVVAALAAGLAAGASLSLAAQLANTAAGIVVGKVGTAVAYPQEVLAALADGGPSMAESKFATRSAAADRIAAWRRQGLRVSFTNGCFDLLHPGHVSLLHQARATADRLVVGLNSDASVRRLKGPQRPVQDEAARATVLASLAAVDLVVLFDEDTPLALIEGLRPDVLVKGADYTVEQVVGADSVMSWGGRVVLADLLPGHSTTATVAKLRG